MNKKIFHIIILSLQFFFFNKESYSQILETDSTKLRVAIFSPLYLDSAYSGSEYKLSNDFLPKYLLPGLEFYNGTLLAIDSLRKENISVQFDIYDLKQSTASLKKIIEDSSFLSTQLMIAAITTPEELSILSKISKDKKIPLISATYPRTSGVEENEGFVLISSSLTTHIEHLYKFLQKNYALDNLLLFSSKANSGKVIKMLYNQQASKTASVPLKYKTIDLEENFTYSKILQQLDSTKLNVIIAGDIDETFGIELVKNMSNLSQYKHIIIGMPTWNGLKEFNTAIVKNVSYIYSTPYNFFGNKSLLQYTEQKYKSLFISKPSDFAFKSFEAVFHFTKLLHKYKSKFVENLSSNEFIVFSNYDINPVYNKSSDSTIQFLENYKIYFVTRTNGEIVSIQE